MGSVFGIIVWVVIVLALKSLGKKSSTQNKTPGKPSGRQRRPSLDLPPEILEILKASSAPQQPAKQTPAPVAKPRVQAKPKRTIAKPVDSHAGESYASPIPEPYFSPMVGEKTPAQRHAEAHVGTVEVKDNLKVHGASAVAKHADSHIATTHAVPTPRNGAVHKSPLAGWVPRGEMDLRKALVMSEILGAPKSLR